MYTIDASKLAHSIKTSPHKSISSLASSLGIHRNTIQYYLAEHPIINNKLYLILEALNLNLKDCLIKKELHKTPYPKNIANLIDELHKTFSDVSFILFGSRTKKSNHHYSDWDIGVYKKDGLEHKEFRKLLIHKSELEEDLPFFIDLVNLNRADPDFLKNIASSWQFLTGKLSDWIAINEKVGSYDKEQ